LVAASYLVGTFPTAEVGARRAGHDPTAEGSGNPGASNVYRVAGRRAGVAVAIGDVAKGVVPTAVGLAAGGRPLAFACGAAAVLGHVAPVTRRLRGGKGVATAGGLAAVLYPRPSAAVAAAWAGTAKLTGKASVASLVAVAAMPLLVAAERRPAWEAAATAGVAAMIVLRHRTNIGRLLRDEEAGLRPEDAS
jgi:glycerol-3-phosphate acyltransferase PlsY